MHPADSRPSDPPPDDHPRVDDRLSVDDLHAIDDICLTFDRAWRASDAQAGNRPRIEARLVGWTGSRRARLLVELLAVEREYREERGEKLDAEEVRRRFPHDVDAVDTFLLHGRAVPQVGPPHTPEMPDTPDTPETGSRPVSSGGVGASPETLVFERGSAFDPGSQGGRLVDLLAGYHAAVQNGQNPDRERLVAEHPELADQLQAALAGIDFVQSTTANAVHSPRRLGDFRILREIGRGGMGAVYEAEQISLGRRVALKILWFGAVSDPEALRRFQREAETVARLHHTNIVPVFSVGREGAVNYYAMQLIDGRSLDLVAKERGEPLELLMVADWGLQAAEALAHAHQRGVVHRDVKPSNLILDGENRVWLTDFGLAKRSDDVTLSITGTLLGTPRYMSPEQASAARRAVDHRTDLYSLGATLYELVTGRPVFEADSAHGVISQILSATPLSPRVHRPGLPRDFETILLKCLAKDAAKRYASAKELSDDLRAFVEGRSIKARRPTVLEIASRWLKQQRRSVAIVSLAAAATLVLVVGVLLAWYGYANWRLSRLTLRTSSPPLVAEILHSNGEPAARPETVPTQEPATVPAGDYLIRVSGQGQLSQTFLTSLPRGLTSQLTLSLREHSLVHQLDVAYSVHLGQVRGGAQIVRFDEASVYVGRWDAPTLWSVAVATFAEPERAPGLLWPPNKVCSDINYSGWGPYDLRPWLVTDALDLNGDGQSDTVIAARHQAWIAALSGKEGTVLWVAARGSDVRGTLPADRRSLGVRSTVVTAPQLLPDIDDDHVPDLLLTLADSGADPHPAPESLAASRRWVEAISGATGDSLWRFDLDSKWFELPPGDAIPSAFRWFVTNDGGSMSGGSSSGSTSAWGQIRWIEHRVERTGNQVYLPHVRLSRWRERPYVLVLAGRHMIGLDPASGTSLIPAVDTGVRPELLPESADVDGDGTDDLVMISPDVAPNSAPGTTSFGAIPDSQLTAWSPNRRLLWTRPLQVPLPHSANWWLSAPHWPHVADIDGDRAAEVIVPNGTSAKASFAMSMAPWGRFDVLDGRNGQPRWSQQVMNMDQRVEHFTAGPDIDGDGYREVYVASLWSRELQLFVDCFSGQDGRPLWHRGHPLAADFEWHQLPLQWWSSGKDGWQQLMVPLQAGSQLEQTSLCLFSSGTGEVTHVATNIHAVDLTDADGDGNQDLAILEYKVPATATAGSRLSILRGAPGQRWQSLGTEWTPAADLDQDGVCDLVGFSGNVILTASGATGRRLWQADEPRSTYDLELVEVNDPRGNETGSPTGPPAWDLDRDGVPDLLVLGKQGFGTFSPLHAHSGRTGRLLWSAKMDVQAAGKIRVSCLDLDRDGDWEVVVRGFLNWREQRSRTYSGDEGQLWLAVFSGRTGRLKWRQSLSREYGNGQPRAYLVDNPFPEMAVGDFNGDGVDDLVVSAESESANLAFELRSLNGRDGSLLWRRDATPTRPQDLYDVFRDGPTFAVQDLGLDGRDDLIVLEIKTSSTAQGQQRVAGLTALDGSSGEQRWRWQAPVSESCGRQGYDPQLQPRPTALRTRDGRVRWALNLDTHRQTVFVVDPSGQTLGQVPLESKTRFGAGYAIWACDCDGDGDDELLVDNGDLIALRPDQLPEPVRRFSLGESFEIQTVRRGGFQLPASIVTMLDKSGNLTLASIDAGTGQLQWQCPGLTRLGERISVLSAGNPTEESPPLVLFRHGQTSLVRQAVWRTSDPGAVGKAQVPSLAAANTLSLQVDAAPVDPRLRRPLPWRRIFEFTSASETPVWLMWAVAYCSMLLLVPAAYLWRLVRTRRWSLRTLLTGPAVAGCVVLACLVDGPASEMQGIPSKLTLAFVVAPSLLWGMATLSWLARGRWRKLVAWGSVSLLASVALGAAQLVGAPREQGPLLFGESYSWAGWYLVWFPAAYVTSWLFVLATALTWIWNRARRFHPQHS